MESRHIAHLLIAPDATLGSQLMFSDLTAFISGYKSTNDASWWASNLDRASYYTWNTLNFALNNSDLRKEQNVIYWHNAETGRWHPCIWDVDLLFEDAGVSLAGQSVLMLGAGGAARAIASMVSACWG